MTLSAPVAREELHTRRIEIKGYRRGDGLWDIEAHLVDAKPFAYALIERPRAAGEPVHDMWLRLTIDEDFLVQAAEAAMPAGAYAICPAVAPNFSALAGLRIGPGWNRQVRERLGGVRGCTHLVEVLAQMATTAMQTLWSERALRAGGDDDGEDARIINTCYAYRSDGPVVRRRWPELYTGERTGGTGAAD